MDLHHAVPAAFRVFKELFSAFFLSTHHLVAGRDESRLETDLVRPVIPASAISFVQFHLMESRTQDLAGR